MLIAFDMSIDPTLRFSSRAENYAKYRPGYPGEILETLRDECGLQASSRIADIGSGTGVMTELFLLNGNPVFAVEPNSRMRATAEALLHAYPGFQSVAGKAEATNLGDSCVEFAVVGTAFHWFNIDDARREFLRILRPPGWAMLVWNEREFKNRPFPAAYDRLLQRYSIDYAREKHKHVYDTGLSDFFGPRGFVEKTFANVQQLDFEGARGRMLSSSYTPEPGHANHEPMVAELRRIFEMHQVDGKVTFEYITRMYYGRMKE